MGHDFLKARSALARSGRLEDTADGAGHFGALLQAGDIGLGVLLEMKLAAVPRDGREDGRPGRTQDGVIIADQELDARQAALLEAEQEGFAPVGFRLRSGRR